MARRNECADCRLCNLDKHAHQLSLARCTVCCLDAKQTIIHCLAFHCRSLLPGVLFVCNIVVGWYGLQLVNVPMFLAIRRTNAAFTLVAEWVLLSKASTLPVVQSVCLIVLGAVITGWESLQSDWLGIVYTIGNNVFTAASMSLTKQFSDRTGVRGFGVVLYNAVVALPLCLIGAFLSNEVQYTFDVTQFPSGHSPLFWASFITASSMGVFMSYIVFLCTTVNSPLATSITGNIKDIASTLVAALLFSDFKATGMNMLGLFVSFAGAAWFSIVKLQQMQQPLLPTKKGDPLTSSVLHFDSAANSGNTGGGNSSSSGTTMEAQPSPQQVQLQLNEASSYTSDAIAPSPASDAYSLRNSSGVYHAAAGRRRGGAGEVVTSLP